MEFICFVNKGAVCPKKKLLTDRGAAVSIVFFASSFSFLLRLKSEL
jgi:hypothetical protein